MVGRVAQGNPWAVGEIAGIVESTPTREEVVAELLHFMRDTVAEMGEQRATGFLKKFYGWYLGRGRFPKPFANELVRLETIDQVEERLLAAAPGANEVLARLEADAARDGQRRPRSSGLHLRRGIGRPATGKIQSWP